MPLSHLYTADDVAHMPSDGNRYEVVAGELLVTPAPSAYHQTMIGRLVWELRTALYGQGLQEQLLTAPADITFGADALVQPDLFVADVELLLRSNKWSDVTRLFLAVEIVSPASRRADRVVKRRLYQAQRVDEYWIVDQQRGVVEVWTPGADAAVVVRDHVVWRHPAANVQCSIDVRALCTFPT